MDWRLHAAADAGREAAVRRAIADGWPIDEFDDDLGWTALHNAARTGHLGIVRMLLAAGSDVNRHCEDRIDEQRSDPVSARVGVSDPLVGPA